MITNDLGHQAGQFYNLQPPAFAQNGCPFERNTHIKMVHDLLHRIGGLVTGAFLFFWGGNCNGVKPPERM